MGKSSLAKVLSRHHRRGSCEILDARELKNEFDNPGLADTFIFEDIPQGFDFEGTFNLINPDEQTQVIFCTNFPPEIKGASFDERFELIDATDVKNWP